MFIIPKVRSEALLTLELDDELVVYDTEKKTAHRLNSTASRVWRRVDGERSVKELATELGWPESLVGLAIDQLAEARLVTDVPRLTVSRRQALRRMAGTAAAGMILPALASIPAPQPAAAQSGPVGNRPPHDETERRRDPIGRRPRRSRRRRRRYPEDR